MSRFGVLTSGIVMVSLIGCGGSGPSSVSATGGSSGGESPGAGSGGANQATAGKGGGGSGGAEVPLVPVVLDCDALGAVGTWERIGPPPSFTDRQTVSSAVDPNHFGTVYVGVGQSGIWKSENCGADWVKINEGTNKDKLDSGLQWQLTVDPVNSDLYAISGYGGNGLYRSKDGGKNFEDITPKGEGIPDFVQGFSLDPDDHNHVLVGYHQDCTGPYAPMCFANTTNVSDPAGIKWTFQVGPAKGWEEGAGPMLVSKDLWLYAAVTGLQVSADAGAKWTTAIPYPGCSAGYIRAKGNYYIGCLDGVFQSPDAQTWTKLENSHRASSIVLAGETLYTTYQDDPSGQPVWSAPIDRPTEWTAVKTPPMSQGASAENMTYDSMHKVLYVPAWSAGLWRAVVE